MKKALKTMHMIVYAVLYCNCLCVTVWIVCKVSPCTGNLPIMYLFKQFDNKK